MEGRGGYGGRRCGEDRLVGGAVGSSERSGWEGAILRFVCHELVIWLAGWGRCRRVVAGGWMSRFGAGVSELLAGLLVGGGVGERVRVDR